MVADMLTIDQLEKCPLPTLDPCYDLVNEFKRGESNGLCKM